MTTRIKTAKKKRILIIIASVLVAVIVALGVVAALLLPGDGEIAKGVRVGNISLGGMTVEEARKAVEENEFYNGSFTIVSQNERVTVTASDIELEIDAGKSALNAYKVGHDGGFFKRLAESMRLLTVGIDVPPSPVYHEGKLDALIYNLGVKINGEPQPKRIEDISDTSVRIYPQGNGQNLNVTEQRNEVIDKLGKVGMNSEITIDLPASGPEKLTAQELYDFVLIEGMNAGYEIKGKELIIFDEMPSRTADKAEIERNISAFNSGEPIELSVTRTMPEITADMLRADLFSTELASYTSTYSTSAANRAFNVNRAANSVNGTILLPGQVFSYNEAIGNPSSANGYKIASVFSNGKQTQGVGGGVCQVSSTIYSAILYANLEIVERRSHSLTVNYVPKGQDATVSYGTQDFKFKNNYDKPIKIVVSAVGGVCKVQILGSKPDVERKVELFHSVVATNGPTDNITYSDTLAEGTRKVTSKGKTGYVVDSVRKVYENGVEVKTEKLTRSNYRMVQNEVVIGRKPAATMTPSPEATPAPTPQVTHTPSPDIQQQTPPSAPAEPTTPPTPVPTPPPTQTPNSVPTPTPAPTPVPTTVPMQGSVVTDVVA